MGNDYRWLVIVTLLTVQISVRAGDSLNIWLQLEPGLSQGIFESPQKSEYGDSKITVLKIDPTKFEMDLYCESNFGDKKRTIKGWIKDFHLVAAINAGMYGHDYLTSIGFLKSGDHYNNSRLNSKHNCIFACGPLSDDVPPAQIIDLRCQNFDFWENKYQSYLQSIRMISCQQKNVWQQQPQKWSIAALAIDNSGNVLFIHSRSPYSVHDFINILLNAPFDIYNAMYLEGGSVAKLHYKTAGIERTLNGFIENGLFLNGSNQKSQPIPNIIGVRRKDE